MQNEHESVIPLCYPLTLGGIVGGVHRAQHIGTQCSVREVTRPHGGGVGVKSPPHYYFNSGGLDALVAYFVILIAFILIIVYNFAYERQTEKH